MRLEIRSRGVKVNERLRAHVEERFRLALGRFTAYVGDVMVYLRNINGPRGGLDKVCRVVVEVPRYGRVVVAVAYADVFGAVAHTARRTQFAVRRRVKRRLAQRRPSRTMRMARAGAPAGLSRTQSPE